MFFMLLSPGNKFNRLKARSHSNQNGGFRVLLFTDTSLRIFKENLPRDENVSRKTSKNVSWESCCFKIFKSCRTFCRYYHNIFIQG